MDRQIIYPGQIPLDTDLLFAQRFGLEGLGRFIAAVMGQAGVTVVDGLAVTQSTPASLNIMVSPGTIMVEGAIDNASYGSLAAQPARKIMCQGALKDAQTVPITVPVTVGHSINYLIQVGFNLTDEEPIVLPYYNADNPDLPYSGPENSGVAQMTVRRGVAVVTAKASSSAVTGTQVTPSADPGSYPLAVVTVAYGATTLTSANITQHPLAPYLIAKLPEIPYRTQEGIWIYGQASGTANALTTTLFPKPAVYPKAMIVKAAANNTGAATINPNGLGAVPIVQANGDPLTADMIIANMPMLLIFNGSAYFLMNVNTSTFDPETPPDRNIENIGKVSASELYIGIDGVTGNYKLRKVRGVALGVSIDPTDGELVIDATALLTSVQVIAPIHAEVETADGRLAFTTSTGQIVINEGQSFIHRGARRIETTAYDVGLRTFATAVNKTYHLRWQWNGGAPQFVLKDTADTGYSGGAAESSPTLDGTYDDVLLARIVTNASNSLTVTPLANKAVLTGLYEKTSFHTGTNGWSPLPYMIAAINWARTPQWSMRSCSNEVDHGITMLNSLVTSINRYQGLAKSCGYAESASRRYISGKVGMEARA